MLERIADGWRLLKKPDKSRNPRGFLIVFVGVAVGVVAGVCSSIVDLVGVVDPLGGGDSLTLSSSLSDGRSGIVSVLSASNVVTSERAVGANTGDCNADIVLDAILRGRCGLKEMYVRSKIE